MDRKLIITIPGGVIGSAALLLTISIILAIANPGGNQNFFQVPGHILFASFSWAAFYIPMYLGACVALLLLPNYKRDFLFLLNASLIPFFTLALLLRLIGNVSASPITSSYINSFGQNSGALFLGLLLPVEGLIIHRIYTYLFKEQSTSSKRMKNRKRSSVLHLPFFNKKSEEPLEDIGDHKFKFPDFPELPELQTVKGKNKAAEPAADVSIDRLQEDTPVKEPDNVFVSKFSQDPNTFSPSDTDYLYDNTKTAAMAKTSASSVSVSKLDENRTNNLHSPEPELSISNTSSERFSEVETLVPPSDLPNSNVSADRLGEPINNNLVDNHHNETPENPDEEIEQTSNNIVNDYVADDYAADDDYSETPENPDEAMEQTSNNIVNDYVADDYVADEYDEIDESEKPEPQTADPQEDQPMISANSVVVNDYTDEDYASGHYIEKEDEIPGHTHNVHTEQESPENDIIIEENGNKTVENVPFSAIEKTTPPDENTPAVKGESENDQVNAILADLIKESEIIDEMTNQVENQNNSKVDLDEDDFEDAWNEDQDEFGNHDQPVVTKKYVYDVPIEGLLKIYDQEAVTELDEETKQQAEVLQKTLEEFKIMAEVTGIRKGPVITMFELLPAPGVKLSRIVNLADNIALRLAASSVRIVAPIPGKHAVGIEIPNKKRSIVSFSEMIASEAFQEKDAAIPIVLGKDISGDTQVIDLAKTPHLLIAGATGSGKSVCVNSLICSLLYKRSPEEVKMIMVDPKVVELKFYNDIPHLLTPVITDPKRALQAIQWTLYEMERRYSLLDAIGVRDIKSYNKKIKQKSICTTPLPYIVLMVDEFADLMATSGKELEGTLARLAAMSRAVGIHLVLATQRPSIDVITGLIKANFPSRIAFMVASKTDSRIILDGQGAEKLLGKGDMLFTSSWNPFPSRIQGAFLSEEEVERVVTHVKSYGEPDYIDDEIFFDDDDDEDGGDYDTSVNDPLLEKAVDVVIQAGKASASYLQRRLKIGYNRAARIVEDMEARGIVGPQNGSKPRDIIHVPDWYQPK